jgi:hypothetical protein
MLQRMKIHGSGRSAMIATVDRCHQPLPKCTARPSSSGFKAISVVAPDV